MMDAARFSGTSVHIYQTTRVQIPEDGIFQAAVENASTVTSRIQCPSSSLV